MAFLRVRYQFVNFCTQHRSAIQRILNGTSSPDKQNLSSSLDGQMRDRRAVDRPRFRRLPPESMTDRSLFRQAKSVSFVQRAEQSLERGLRRAQSSRAGGNSPKDVDRFMRPKIGIDLRRASLARVFHEVLTTAKPETQETWTCAGYRHWSGGASATIRMMSNTLLSTASSVPDATRR